MPPHRTPWKPWRGLGMAMLLALATALAYACTLVPPRLWWPAQLAGYALPPLLLAQCLLLLWLGLRLRLAALLPALVLVLGWGQLRSIVAFGSHAPCAGQLKVIGYNVQTFRGHTQLPASKLAGGDSLLHYLAHSGADILCLQEFHNVPRHPVYESLKRLKKAGYKHIYYIPTMDKRAYGSIGLAIASKHPMVGRGQVLGSPGSNNLVMYADVKWQGRTLRVYNLHLQSTGLSQEELSLDKKSTQEARSSLSAILGKLAHASPLRQKQVEALLAHAARWKGPVLLVGDFNEMPLSFVINAVRRQYSNTFEAVGQGFGFTHHGAIPFLRIDHQFYGGGLQPCSFTVHDSLPYSDHYATVATYALPAGPAGLPEPGRSTRTGR